MGAGCLDLSVGCLGLSVGLLKLSVGCLDLFFRWVFALVSWVSGCVDCVLSWHYQKTNFSHFFEVLGVRDQSQSQLQVLRLNFPSKVSDLDAYVSSYSTFRRFWRGWEVANPFLMICDSFSWIWRPRRSSSMVLKRSERVWEGFERG